MVRKRNYIKHPPLRVRQYSYYFLNHEKILLEENYDFLDCKIKSIGGKNNIVVVGHYNQTGKLYTYQITYDGYNAPTVKILSPTLIEAPPHVYKDLSLCLYYPQKTPWSNKTCNLYSHIIPWVHEWILYYEIYLITGVWEHPEVKHVATKKQSPDSIG